ncbi:MSMEG_4193 family putative phosphomutase [Ornithinimicrobium cerasi]|uniref:Probable phosphomutase, MSMEG_4193 family n=1 Tax=Ornithinimicrobium cerasi TaxID=2248773 RepID=A0A285VKR7_9MICO|nr:MSMEG_4193 family putative phosphomutase [Ornithinimicrobium cerasi]SOC54467.1 probable phosphomutase, MSMEG_4193 family [Ornithinimicrobium cerasi]
MAICVLVRHGRTSANTSGLLAGWTPGVALDDTGAAQARALGDRLSGAGLVAVVTSPLQRCLETAAGLTGGIPEGDRPRTETDERLGEARYGAWTGRPLSELAKDPLWRDVQDRPSRVTFPAHADHEHESIAQMQQRALEAVQGWDARFEAEHGPAAVWAAVSHGDVIKAVLAASLAMPLDEFQRLVVDPASVSVVHLTSTRSFVLRLNDTGSDPVDLGGLTARLAAASGNGGDAVVGGGAGTGPART